MADDTNTAEREAFRKWAEQERAAGCVGDMEKGWLARASLAVRAHNIVALSQLPPPAHNERVYGGYGNEIVHSYYTEHQMREYARQEVFRAEEAWQARASLAASAGSEPVAWAVFAENGNIRIWSQKPLQHPAMPLYTHPSPPEGMAGWRDIATAPKDGTAILLGSRCGSWIGKWLPVYVSGYRPENPWSSLMLNHDHMGEKWCKPTHWMPLPKAPEPPASEAKEL